MTDAVKWNSRYQGGDIPWDPSYELFGQRCLPSGDRGQVVVRPDVEYAVGRRRSTLDGILHIDRAEQFHLLAMGNAWW
jgi:hypothetical protein